MVKLRSVRGLVMFLGFGLLGFVVGVLRAQPAEKPDTFVEFVEAARLGDVPTVKRLLAAGQDVNQRDGHAYHYPALFHALEARQFDTARALIEAGADLKKDADGAAYALLWAAQAGDAGIVRLMLQKGALPHVRWVNKQTGYLARYPIEEALAWGRVEVIQELEKAGVRWIDDDRGAYALALASTSRRVEATAYLISTGADVNAPYQGTFRLSEAASRGDLALMKLLLAKGAQVNAVSQGAYGFKDWDAYRRTALVSAVIGSQLEAVRLLLQSGADPKTLNNLAIKWADMLGDYEAYDLLRKAGAPDPGPFAYREWLNIKPVSGLAPLEEVRKNKTLSAPLAAVTSTSAGEAGPALVRPTKFAIITLGADLDNAESVLAARLSSLDQAVVLERTNIRAILKERTLTQNFGRAPGDAARLGRLLGADALVVLRTYPIEAQQVIESRIVSVATGLVTSTESVVADAAKLPEWSTAVAKRCAADGMRIFTPPHEARLVAISPFTASVNTPEARELERQLGTLVALRLAQLPGIFLVEREMLDRLQAEGRAEDMLLLNGSWLVSGSVEKSLNDAGASLQLALKPGGGGATREIKVASALAGTVKLAAEAVTQAEVILSTAPAQAWAPEAEAAAFLQQAEAFFARKMWAQAQAAAGAARALGLRDDRGVRIQMESAANRIKFSVRYFSAAKRKTHELSGVVDLMSYRVPLLLPPEDDRELAVGDYFEQANLILDCLEPVLSRHENKIGGVDYFDWVCGQAWDSATLALKVTEALSYQRDFGDQRVTLQARLLALNTRALQVACERNDAKLVHTLIALRCKHIVWWVQGDAAFQAEVRSVLGEAKGWAPPFSEHAVWGALSEIGRSHMGFISGRASQSWVRLAEVMAQSADVRERYLGTALLGIELYKVAGSENVVELTMALLKQDFPELVELDRSIPARMRSISYDYEWSDGPGNPFTCWYYDVFKWQSRDTWEPGSGITRMLPEMHNFYFKNVMRRLELISKHGPSGFFAPFNLRYRKDATPEEDDQLTERWVQAKIAYAPLLKTYPEIADAAYPMNIPSKMPESRAKTSVKSEVRLILRNPRLLFESELSSLSADKKTSAYTFRGDQKFYTPLGQQLYNGNDSKGEVLYGFKPDGSTCTLLSMPTFDKHGYLIRIDVFKSEGVDDFSANYFAAPGKRSENSNEEWSAAVNCIIVYSFADKQWLTLMPAQKHSKIYNVRIFGDKVFYAFIHNPAAEAAGDSSYNYERQGDPLRGVMQYDLKTKQYELLASNRRNPGLSPIDGPGKEYTDFEPISDEEFSLKGSSEHVYNTRLGTWRARVPADKTSANAKAKARVANRISDNQLKVGGINWWLECKQGKLECTNKENRNKWVTVSVPLELIDTGFVERVKPYEKIVRDYKDALASRSVKVRVTQHGAAFIVSGAYYWVQLEQLKQVVTQAYEASGLAASAKPDAPQPKPAAPASASVPAVPGSATAAPVAPTTVAPATQ